jgi:hypothetical protein
MKGILRTRETIEALKRVPATPGQTSPLLIYFGTILSKSSLNALESVELGKLVISQNKKALLDNWYKVREHGVGWGGVLSLERLRALHCSMNSWCEPREPHPPGIPCCARCAGGQAHP